MSILQISSDGTGKSDAIDLPEGRYLLLLTWAGAAGDTNIEVGALDASVDADYVLYRLRDGTALSTIVTSYMVEVPGRLRFRLSVTTETTVATLRAVRVGPA